MAGERVRLLGRQHIPEREYYRLVNARKRGEPVPAAYMDMSRDGDITFSRDVYAPGGIVGIVGDNPLVAAAVTAPAAVLGYKLGGVSQG